MSQSDKKLQIYLNGRKRLKQEICDIDKEMNPYIDQLENLDSKTESWMTNLVRNIAKKRDPLVIKIHDLRTARAEKIKELEKQENLKKGS